MLFGFWEKNQENPKVKSSPKEKAQNTHTLSLSLSSLLAPQPWLHHFLTLLLLFPRSQALPFGPLRESSTLIGFCFFFFFVWLWCLVRALEELCVFVLCCVVYYLSVPAMEDSTKLRLVRCPKCQNVLPELANYTIYQCGACNTVLRGTLSSSPSLPQST